jgi:hypothetical protein
VIASSFVDVRDALGRTDEVFEQANRDVRLWHKADMVFTFANVRFDG